jgi:hypothetical protein
MQTKRSVLWNLAVWLARAFSTLAAGPPAIAACHSTGQAAPVPHACCLAHSAACACHAGHPSASDPAAFSGACQMRDCPCARTGIASAATSAGCSVQSGAASHRPDDHAPGFASAWSPHRQRRCVCAERCASSFSASRSAFLGMSSILDVPGKPGLLSRQLKPEER